MRRAILLVISGENHNPPTRTVPAYPIVWVTTAIAGLTVYTFSGYVNKEVWFDNSSQISVRTLQMIEGFINAVVICLAPMFFSLGLLCIEHIRTRLETTKKKDEAARKATGILASAGAGPFISVFLAWAFWKLIQFLATKPPKFSFFGTAKPAMVIVAQILTAMPFFVLLLLTQWRKRHAICLLTGVLPALS